MQQLQTSIDNISIPLDYQLENNYFHSTFDQRKTIPDHIWVNRFRCADFQACIKQNSSAFGFIPVSPLAIYTGDPKYWETIPDIRCINLLNKLVYQTT